MDPAHINSLFWVNIYRFHYMAVADNRQRYMPLPDDRLPERGEPLATPEAVLLVNPVEPEFKGEVFSFFLYFFCLFTHFPL
jgi:hypothetical protein